MAKRPPAPRRSDQFSDVVDRLLAKLPGADPMLEGNPEEGQPEPRPGAPAVAPRARSMPAAAVPGGPTARDRGLAWLVAMLGLALGAAMTQWPYPRACGVGLFSYFAAILTLLLVGGWAAIAAWRCRTPAVHVTALVLVFWGIVLAAEQILPRAGYAYQTATWTCEP